MESCEQDMKKAHPEVSFSTVWCARKDDSCYALMLRACRRLSNQPVWSRRFEFPL